MHKLGPGYGHNQSPESSKNSQPLFYPSKISNSTAFFSNFHVSLKLRIFVILFSFFPLSYLSSSSFFTRCLSLIPQTSNMVLLFSLSLSLSSFLHIYIWIWSCWWLVTNYKKCTKFTIHEHCWVEIADLNYIWFQRDCILNRW